MAIHNRTLHRLPPDLVQSQRVLVVGEENDVLRLATDGQISGRRMAYLSRLIGKNVELVLLDEGNMQHLDDTVSHIAGNPVPDKTLM